jgi:hypothetical protein
MVPDGSSIKFITKGKGKIDGFSIILAFESTVRNVYTARTSKPGQ